jgi:predicted PurR-regulated permease PerM
MQYQKLGKAVRILLIIVVSIYALYHARPFLVPVAFGALLSMLLVPISRWLEHKGVNKTVSTLLSILAFVIVFAGIITFISWQVADLAKDASQIEQQVGAKYNQIRDFIAEKAGIPPQKQQEIVQQQQKSSTGKMSAMITGFLSGLGTFLTSFLLVLVYVFLFIYFRGHIKAFILRLVPQQDKANAQKIVTTSQKVAQKYLTGLSFMIIILWVMYGIGFSIVGVKNALFFAVLCGLLEIIPFVGNLTGTLLTIGTSLVQGGDMNMVIGIAITYGLVQFIQSYVIEPLVVGAEVSLNPLFTIIGIVAGEMIWGIPGMILAIPIMGIAKIICDNIEPLKPFGFLLGGANGKKSKGFGEKIKGWFR